jgi:hypothetical protein
VPGEAQAKVQKSPLECSKRQARISQNSFAHEESSITGLSEAQSVVQFAQNRGDLEETSCRVKGSRVCGLNWLSSSRPLLTNPASVWGLGRRLRHLLGGSEGERPELGLDIARIDESLDNCRKRKSEQNRSLVGTVFIAVRSQTVNTSERMTQGEHGARRRGSQKSPWKASSIWPRPDKCDVPRCRSANWPRRQTLQFSRPAGTQTINSNNRSRL